MNHTQTPEENFGKKWPNYIVAGFVLISIAVAAWFAWQGYQLKQTESQLLIAIENQKQNLVELKEREKIGEKMKAAEILNKAKKYRKNWSQVLKSLNETFTSRGDITFSSVSVDSGNVVKVNASAKDLLTAASFLLMVKRSDDFDNGFISNISPSTTSAEGVSEYQFNATFDYLETTDTTQNTNLTSSDQS